MTKTSPDVDRFMAALEHPLKDGVQQLRTAILASDDGLSEHVKWNAPSFRYGGEDRVTFRLRPRDQLQLVFHRGAAVRGDAAEFSFADPTGLLVWPAPDRGVLTLADQGDVDRDEESVVALVGLWVRA